MNLNYDTHFTYLTNYLKEEHLDKKKCELDVSSFKVVHVESIPQQDNNSDCGMFLLKYMDYLSRGENLTFSCNDMPYYRRRMVYELLHHEIMFP